MILITENLMIRKFNIDDTGAYFKNSQDAQIKKYMPNHSHGGESEAREEVKEFISGYAGAEPEQHYAVLKDGALIGHIGIGASDGIAGACEICCGIIGDYRGFNYASEAVGAFAPWCLDKFGLDKIYASTEPENIPAAKSLIKAGFILTDIKIENKELDTYVFKLI